TTGCASEPPHRCRADVAPASHGSWYVSSHDLLPARDDGNSCRRPLGSTTEREPAMVTSNDERASGGMARTTVAMLLALMVSAAGGCGINNIPTYDEQVKAAWAQVQNQYQRRADLVPNLVETVKGYAAHERETLEAVVEARAKVNQMNV